MFQRIHVHIIPMPLIVGIVSDQMLPLMTLPDSALPGGFAAIRPAFGLGQCTREAALDQSPSPAEIAVIGWQVPHAMQVIRQYQPGLDSKTGDANAPASPPRVTTGPAVQWVVAVALRQIDRNELDCMINRAIDLY
ncbi:MULTISPECIES: hypothetical protein [Methylococcus]|uniref:hypothetical protein n=1 Tax=Methylococcus TaxID=413 RepID=UPI001C52E214|nr:hypothetical protein [Methylococcus capsulatus]QXP91859.1 hypothetical protein KW114_06905 [Methylococcus capsulatus]